MHWFAIINYQDGFMFFLKPVCHALCRQKKNPGASITIIIITIIINLIHNAWHCFVAKNNYNKNKKLDKRGSAHNESVLTDSPEPSRLLGPRPAGMTRCTDPTDCSSRFGESSARRTTLKLGPRHSAPPHPPPPSLPRRLIIFRSFSRREGGGGSSRMTDSLRFCREVNNCHIMWRHRR